MILYIYKIDRKNEVFYEIKKNYNYCGVNFTFTIKY